MLVQPRQRWLNHRLSSLSMLTVIAGTFWMYPNPLRTFISHTFLFMFLVNLFVPTASSSWNVKQLQLLAFDSYSWGELSVLAKLKIKSNNSGLEIGAFKKLSVS